MKRAALAAALAAMLAGVAPAAAERREEQIAADEQGGNSDPKAAAEHLALAAKARFDAKDYAGAIAAYGAAYRRRPSAGLLFNLAQSYRLHGNCAAASLMYHEYLRKAPDSPYRSLAERHLDALSACSQGQAFATVGYGGAAGGAAMFVPDGDRQRGRGKKAAGVVFGVAGAAMIGTGAYLLTRDGDGATGAAALDKDKDEDDVVTARDGDAERARRRDELLGAGLLGAGGVAVISGVTLYVMGRQDERAARTTFALTPNRGGVTAAVGWRF